MASIKTAISIDAKLFKSIEKRSKRLGVSRSKFFADAAAAYLNRFDRESITEQINRAVEGGLDPTEQQWLAGSKRAFAKILKDDPW